MRLTLAPEARWIDLSVRIEVTDLRPAMPGDPAGASGVTAHGDAIEPSAPGARVEVLREANVVSALGWPVSLLELRVWAADGRVIEHQLHARYRVLEWAGAVIASGPPDAVVAHRDGLWAVLLAARPEASGDVTSIEQLFAGVAIAPG